MISQQLSKSDIKKACDILRRDDGVGAGNYVEQLSWLLFLRVFENVEAQLKEITEAEGKKYKTIIDKEYQWSSWAKKDWKDKDELIHFVSNKLFPYLRKLKDTNEKEKIGEIFRELDGNKIRSPYTLLDVIEILDKIEMTHYQDTHFLSQVYEEILQEMGAEGGWSGEFYTPRPIIRLMVDIIDPKLGDKILDPFIGSAGFLVESFHHIEENLKKKSKLGVKEWNALQTKTFYGQEKKPLPFLIGTMNMILHRILVPNLIRTNTLMEDVHNVPESQKVDVILTNPPFGGQEHKTVQNNFPIPVAATEGLALQYVMRRLKNGGRCGIVLPEGQILFGGGAFKKIREELLQKFNVHTIISLPQGVFASMGAGVKTNLVFFDKTGSTKEIWFGEVGGKFTKKQVIYDSHFEEVFKKQQKQEKSENTWIVPIDNIAKRNFDLSAKNPSKLAEEELPEPEELLKSIAKSQKETEQILSKTKKDFVIIESASKN
ncbi:type I restriction-modification system subunit M [Patescibacteria group bacterium]|nr:type I restriction-modification system subunit M [Patescibacteria group bacterium]